MIMYRADHLGTPEIDKVEVQKATTLTIWYANGREAREGKHASYHETWIEAYTELLKRQTEKVEKAKRRLQYQIDEMEKIMKLTEND